MLPWIELAGVAAAAIGAIVKRARVEPDVPAKRVDVFTNHGECLYITLDRDGRDALFVCNHDDLAVMREIDKDAPLSFRRVSFPYNAPRRIFKVACSASKAIAMTDAGLFQMNEHSPAYPCDTLTTRIVDISAGAVHFMAWAEDGIYTWGDNNRGQLIHDINDLKIPVKVDFIDPDDIVCASCGAASTVVCTTDYIRGWGWDKKNMIPIKNMSGRRVQAILCAEYAPASPYSTDNRIVVILVNNTPIIFGVSCDSFFTQKLFNCSDSVRIPEDVRRIVVNSQIWTCIGNGNVHTVDFYREFWFSTRNMDFCTVIGKYECHIENGVLRTNLFSRKRRRWHFEKSAHPTIMGRGTADLAEKRIACRLFATAHFVGNADCLLNGAYLPLDLLKVIAREAELI